MNSKLVSAFFAAALFVAPLAATAQDQTLEQLVIEMASTPAQHAAIARYYLTEAEEARQQTKRHEQMASAYNKGRTGGPMGGHCQRLAQKYTEIAQEYAQLAQLHEAESKKAQ